MNALALKDKLGVQVLKDLVQELSPTVPKVALTFLNSKQPSKSPSKPVVSLS